MEMRLRPASLPSEVSPLRVLLVDRIEGPITNYVTNEWLCVYELQTYRAGSVASFPRFITWQIPLTFIEHSITLVTMSDLLFPNTVPTSKELSLIKQVEYRPKITDSSDFFSIHVFNTKTMGATESDIRIPNWYYQHVLRFLWRHRLFLAIHGNSKIKFDRGHRTMIRRYIAYMDAVMEGLLMGCRIAEGNDVTYRSRTFEMYLAVEFYIGRHEFDVCDTWRRANKQPILEAIDVKDLGEYHRTCALFPAEKKST